MTLDQHRESSESKEYIYVCKCMASFTIFHSATKLAIFVKFLASGHRMSPTPLHYGPVVVGGFGFGQPAVSRMTTYRYQAMEHKLKTSGIWALYNIFF